MSVNFDKLCGFQQHLHVLLRYCFCEDLFAALVEPSMPSLLQKASKSNETLCVMTLSNRKINFAV